MPVTKYTIKFFEDLIRKQQIAFDYLGKGPESMTKLDENDTMIPLPESMIPDFDTGGKIDPIVVGKGIPSHYRWRTANGAGGVRFDADYVITPPPIDYDRLASMVAAKVVSMTTGTCKCGKIPDACCQAT